MFKIIDNFFRKKNFDSIVRVYDSNTSLFVSD
jgi:hypothetical protein